VLLTGAFFLNDELSFVCKTKVDLSGVHHILVASHIDQNLRKYIESKSEIAVLILIEASNARALQFLLK